MEYVVTACVLLLLLIFLWMWSGVARARSGRAINAEDARAYRKPHDPAEPEHVVRVLRAHANAQALIVPFLLLGLMHVLLNGNPLLALVTYIVFVVARLLHAVFYLNAAQPWRSLSFALSLLATLVLMASVLVRAAHVWVVT